MTLNTRRYVSPFQFDLLKKYKLEGSLAKKELTTPLWLTQEQAKELGYNQGESDFELTPAEVEAGNVYGKIAQTPIEQPKAIAPEAGGNLRNLLLGLYPEKISGALAGGTKVDELEDFLSKDVQTQIQANPEQFIQQLASKRMPNETRALLDYLNVPADITDQIVGVQDTEIQVFQTLNRIPELGGIDVEELANLIETKPDEFFKLIREGGITQDKKNLLEQIGFTDEEIRMLLRTPYATGTAIDKGQLAIEAEARERERRVAEGKQGKFGRLFTAGVGDLVANMGGVFRWAGAEGIGDKITQAGQFMQVQATPMEKSEFKWQELFDPTSYSFQSTLSGIIRATPTLMTLAIPGIGAYGLAGSIAGKLGLGAFSRAVITGIGGSALSRPLESAMEAARSYDEARARGLSHEEATKAANSVFKKNLTLVGADIVQLTAAFAPTPFGRAGSIIQRGLVKTAQVGGKLAITGLTEGGEEIYQDMLQRQARGEKWKMDADAQQVFAIGAIMGLGMGGGGDILMRVTDKVSAGFTSQQKAQFDGEVRKNKANRLDDTQSQVQAMDKVVESNPDVAKQVETATKEVNQELIQAQLDKIQKPIIPEITEQLKSLGWTDAQITELDQQEIGSIIRNKQRPTLFQPEVTPVTPEVTKPSPEFIEKYGEPLFYTPETTIRKPTFTQLISTQYDAGQKMNVRNVHIGKVGGQEAWADGFMLEIKPVPEKLKLVKGYKEMAKDVEGKPRDFTSLVPDYSVEGKEVKPLLKMPTTRITKTGETFLSNSDGSAYIMADTKYIEYFMKEYPDSKFLIKDTQSPIVVQSKGKTVGVIMPLFVEETRYSDLLQLIGGQPLVPPEVMVKGEDGIYRAPSQIAKAITAPAEVALPKAEAGKFPATPTGAEARATKEGISIAEASRLNAEEVLKAQKEIKPSATEAKQVEFVEQYTASKGQKPPPPSEPITANMDFPSDMPASQQIANHISFEPDKPGLVARFLRGKNKAMSQWVDKLYPIDTFVSTAKKLGADISLEENPYIQARLLQGVTSKATSFLEDGTFGRQFWKMTKGKAVINYKGESLSKILNEVKESEAWRDFSTYLTALRSKELSKLGIKTGITEDIATKAITELETKYSNFPKLSDKIQKYQSDLLDYVQESGLISADLRKTLDSKYASYVPFYRVLEELQGKSYMGKKMVDIASPIKRIKGSELEIINPLESIVKNTYAFINAADRNQVGVGMARLVHDVPELAGLFEPIKTPIAKVASVTAKELGIDVAGFSDDAIEGVFNVFRPSMLTKENVHTVMIDGKKQFFRVDPDLNVALSAMDNTNMGVLWKILSSPAKWLRAGATLSPDFMIRNPARDAMSAMVYSNYGFMPGVDFLRGVSHLLRKDTTYRLYKMSGAEHSMLVSLDREYLTKSFKEIVEGQKFTDYVKHPLQLLQIVSELGEKATRLGEFAKGIKSGVSPLAAGMSSREVTLDFAKAGTQAKAVNQIIAFFNANIRGWDRMVTGFKDHPIRTSAKVIVGITVPSIALWAWNHDDPRWKEIPQWQKDLFWIVMTEDHIYRIPKPFELGVIFGSGPERLLDYLNEKDPKMGKKFLENFLQAGIPGLIPTGAEPIIENITNHSFFLDRPIVPESKQDLPPELQYTEYTSELAKAMGRLLKQSPMKIDNILYGWTAGLGRYATEGIDKILEKTGVVPRKIEPSPTLADLPVVKAFVVRNPLGNSSESVNTFYEELESLTALEQLLKGYVADKKQVDFEKEKAKHPELLFTYDDTTDNYYSASARYLRRVSGELSDIRKLQDKIYKATNMTPEKKRELITELDTVITDMAVRALELIKNPSKETSLLQTPVAEIEARIGVTSNSPLADDAVKLSDIAGDLIQAKGQSPLKGLLERNNKALVDIANLPDSVLYKIDRTSYKGGLTKRQNELLDQYEASTDKKQFLIDNPELKENPKVKWLTEHPEENAILALWGNSKLLTQKAYDIAVKMVEDNDVPSNALEDKVLPPKNLAKPYFEFQDILKERDEASWEAKLHLAKNDKLREFLGLKLSDTPIASLELKVKNRTNFDKLTGYSDEDSPDYIADEKKRAEVVKKFKADNPAFVDDTRRIEAIEKGTTEAPTPEPIIKSHVDYGKLQDKEGVGSSSAEVMLYRVDNPEYDQWRQDETLWGDNALKPVDQSRIPIWRIDVKYDKEDAEYQALLKRYEGGEELAQTKDYLKRNPEYATARRQREAYQKGLTGGMVKAYTDYYSLAEKGYRRERFLMDNSDFAQVVGLTVPLRVPSEQYDVIDEKYEKEDEEYETILKQYDRTQMAEQKQAIEDYLNKNLKYANDRLRRDAYGLYVPDNLVEHYVLYKELPAGPYQKDWFMMENQDFYREVYLGILENERLDFRKTPTREVYAKYLQYQDMPKRMREDYRFDNPDLEDWLILTGKVSGRVSEARRRAALTPRERFSEEIYARDREFDKRIAELRAGR